MRGIISPRAATNAAPSFAGTLTGAISSNWPSDSAALGGQRRDESARRFRANVTEALREGLAESPWERLQEAAAALRRLEATIKNQEM